MRKTFLIFIIITIVGTAMAQTGLYIGYENGGKWDRFHYVNSKGFSMNQMVLNGSLGAYIGYKYKSYTFETGFYSYSTSSPGIDEYNYTTGQVSKSRWSGSAMKNWVIPIRFGKEFFIWKQKAFIKPEISFNLFIATNYYANQSTGGWSEGGAVPGDTTYIPTADSTIALGYRTSKINYGLESSITIGYRIKNKFDIYLKPSYNTCFNTSLYYG